jgi:hypothetical protein
VVDVNYGGSTGYGRAYRHRLDRQWGVVDVDDCIAVVRQLVDQGEVDPKQLLIAGANAGGHTTLGHLAFRNVFSAGTSYFGIADLEIFREQAPRFQRHELDRLVEPNPEAAATLGCEIFAPALETVGLEESSSTAAGHHSPRTKKKTRARTA